MLPWVVLIAVTADVNGWVTLGHTQSDDASRSDKEIPVPGFWVGRQQRWLRRNGRNGARRFVLSPVQRISQVFACVSHNVKGRRIVVAIVVSVAGKVRVLVRGCGY